MVTLRDLENALHPYNQKVHSGIHPDKVWQFFQFIKPEIEKLRDVEIIYPINLFRVTPKVNTEFIIITKHKNYHGIINGYKFIISEHVNKNILLDIKSNNNDIASVFGLDFNSNLSEIRYRLYS